MDEKKRKKGGWLRRLALFFTTLVLVLAVVLVAAYRDGTGFDVLRRYFSYGSESSGDTGFTYDAGRSNRFAAVGDSLAVAAVNAVTFSDGKTTYSQSAKLSHPGLSGGGAHAVGYDVGGTELYVIDGEETVLALQASEDEPFLAASLNGGDYLAVTAEKKGYKGSVSVYDPQGELLFAFQSADHFLTDACVLSDNATVAVAALGQKDGAFLTNLVYYPLNSKESCGSCPISGGLVMGMGSVGGTLAAVADNCLTFTDAKGNVKGSYTYNGGFLREFDLGGGDFVPLLLGRYKSGSAGRLVTVNTAGEEIASLSVDEQILNISAAGRYVAVLYADRMVVYTRELQEYAILMDTTSARDVLMRADGSALLLEEEKATLFLP